ncbi:MAG: arsenite methyltransferase [Ignavibacteriaceae bacterium]
MNKEEKIIKEMVKEKYSEIAVSESGCGCGCSCGPELLDVNMIGDSYDKVEGHVEEADLGLGCGVPTEYADIKEGDVVLDLGSGAGNDVFIARSIVKERGRVIGVDMTEEMINKAKANNKKLGYENVEFKLGEIEALPIESNSADVVISNCVLNLVPDKGKAFSEIYRVMKPGAHFCISDVVIKGEMPMGLQKSAEMYAGCVAGALKQEEYISVIEKAGFKEVKIVKSKEINLPRALILKYLTAEEAKGGIDYNFGIFSITVNGYKGSN